MNKPVGVIGAAAAGALAMYYLDPELGAQRRALLAELVRSGLPGGDERSGRRLPMRRSHLYPAQADPRSDAELRDQLQARMGRMVSHPGAISIQVENGVVRLSGHVLAKERDGLLEQVQQMPGVQRLVNAMTAHDLPQQITGSREAVPMSAATR